MREFGAFVKKEFYHILRDKRTMLIVLVMPVVLIILFGFALSTEVRNVNIAILSPSSDPTVRQIAERLDASEYFTVTQWLDRPEEIDEVMKSGEVQLVVAFGQNFSGGMLSPDGSQMQLIVDASDANMAQSYTSYASGIIAAFGNEMASGGTETVRRSLSGTACQLSLSSSIRSRGASGAAPSGRSSTMVENTSSTTFTAVQEKAFSAPGPAS